MVGRVAANIGATARRSAAAAVHMRVTEFFFTRPTAHQLDRATTSLKSDFSEIACTYDTFHKRGSDDVDLIW